MTRGTDAMSNLMDPDGTNRIVKQRVIEWYAELDEDRNAKLLDPEPEGARWRPLEYGRWLLAAAVGKFSSLRHRLLHERPVV